ncbi:thiamine phosphate synthase [Nitrospira sp.]|nr:thiamine phosphate synthase [Nitrospira sp.]
MAAVDFRLYLVTDRMQTRGRAILPLIRSAVESGLPALQVRERDLAVGPLLNFVADVRRGLRARHPIVLVNDRLDVALATDADGVHLRADSLPASVARRILGAEKLIGQSTHSVDDVRRASDEGADFVVFGPVFETPSKRAYGPPLGLRSLEAVARVTKIPVFAIGGITLEHVAQVRQAGAFGVAVLSSLLMADNVARETADFLSALRRPA